MSKVVDIFKCRCPKCKKGKIFKTNGNIFLLQIPKMKERCTTCNFKFEKETGFFFGAMFVSYAVAVAQMIASFILFWYFLDVSPLNLYLLIVLLAILTSTFNFRISRTIWIYIFYKEKV